MRRLQQVRRPQGPRWKGKSRATRGWRDAATESFPLTVIYADSLAEMVKLGRYSYVHEGVTEEHFSLSWGPARVEAVVVHLDQVVESGDILRELESRGLRPATLPHLLAFGRQYPDQQRKHTIVALGSVWAHSGGIADVCGLCGRVDSRAIRLYWFGRERDRPCRFLAIRG